MRSVSIGVEVADGGVEFWVCGIRLHHSIEGYHGREGIEAKLVAVLHAAEVAWWRRTRRRRGRVVWESRERADRALYCAKKREEKREEAGENRGEKKKREWAWVSFDLGLK